MYLSKILLDMTDERHGLTLTEILRELSKYGIETGRKSLYDDMEALRVYGYDVHSKRDRYVRYYIKNRELCRAEIKLLCDMTASSGILSDSKKNEIIKKLWQAKYMSGIQASDITASASSAGEEYYKNMELICKAMAENKAVNFKYFEWNSYKQRKLVADGKVFTFSPWKLECFDGEYQVIGYDHDDGEMIKLSLANMIMLVVTFKEREGEATCFDSDNGETVNLRLRCDNSVASEVFGKFLNRVTVLSNNEDSFEVSLKTLLNDDIYSWIFTKKGTVRIVSPLWAAAKYEEMLRKGLEL